jgi:hypothetical protein
MRPTAENHFYVSCPECIAKLKELVRARLSMLRAARVRRELTNQAMRFALGLDGDMSVGEAAIHLQKHRNTIINYIHAGKFPGYYYLSARHIRIPFKEVMALQDRGRVRMLNDDGTPVKPRRNAFEDDPAGYTPRPPPGPDEPPARRRNRRRKPPLPPAEPPSGSLPDGPTTP